MHIKKHVVGSLYKLQKEHRVLKTDVIQKIARCYTYAVHQNKGNTEHVRIALLNIVPHLFGEHDKCSNWCKCHQSADSSKHDTEFKPPHDKASHGVTDSHNSSRTATAAAPRHVLTLTGSKLRQDLESIFTRLANDAAKIAPCGTTRQNESFNNIMASKAPKARHYSSSRSL